ncbi:hypothetical protein RIR_jg41085.t2 [Rhizophagus irregularis DAOM 181602=DAOM 197198]|nr:hypothetical protein RIR_jg41085.t2 [Rhizophagus irregularis DAOM 181602=DAOM 197198]
MVNSINSILSVRYYYSTDFFPPILNRFGQRHALESAKRSSPEKLVWLIIKRKSCLYESLLEAIDSQDCLQEIKPSYELSAVINPNHIIIFCQFKR